MAASLAAAKRTSAMTGCSALRLDQCSGKNDGNPARQKVTSTRLRTKLVKPSRSPNLFRLCSEAPGILPSIEMRIQPLKATSMVAQHAFLPPYSSSVAKAQTFSARFRSMHSADSVSQRALNKPSDRTQPSPQLLTPLVDEAGTRENRSHICASASEGLAGSPSPEDSDVQQPPSEWGPPVPILLWCLFSLAVALFACFIGLPFRIEAATNLPQVILIAIIWATITGIFAWQQLSEAADAGQFQARDQRLPPDWHNLFDPIRKKTFYYNSVTGKSQFKPPGLLPSPAAVPSRTSPGRLFVTYLFKGLAQLVLKPLVTAALYVMTVRTQIVTQMKALFFCLLDPFSLDRLWPVLFHGACFLALPQPLPFISLTLSHNPAFAASLNGPTAARFEVALCALLAASLVYELVAFLATMARAARARLPPCDLTWDARFASRFLCALCPALSWRLQPYAFTLDFTRVVLFPLPFGVPGALPVPKWELFTLSWRALLHAAPLVLPVTRVLVAAAAAKPLNLVRTLLCPPVRMGVLVSVATLLLRRQREAYEEALAQKATEEHTEELDKQMLAEFDERLGPGEGSGAERSHGWYSIVID
jgi:hypothetical protein